MPRGVDIDQFGEKLRLLLLRLNLSRAALAQTLAVDKSTVSRWLSGRVTPVDHQMARLTELAAAEVAEFGRVDWDRPVADYTQRLAFGRDAPVVNRETMSDEGMAGFRSLSLGREQALRVAGVYEGLWRMYRPTFANDGEIVVGGVEIAATGGCLAFRYTDGFFGYSGEIYLLGGQLFFFGEEPDRQDELLLMILNPVNWPRAKMLDGIMCGVAGDPGHTPGAMRVILDRIEDLAPDADARAGNWREFEAEIREIDRAGFVASNAADIAEHLRCRVIWPDRADQPDHILAVPFHRTLSKGEREPG